MHKLRLPLPPGADVVAAFIRSIDLSLYRIEFRLANGDPALLVDARGRSVIFRSVQAAREALAALRHIPIELLQDSAYDEMIGQPGRSSNRMNLPVAPLDVTLH